ncbi:Aspartokinase [Klebsiella pneumoniae]|uniref:Aspartokinase n=1 Tax=Klebsiella pneumoniae TaxID=573 RepID=A0A378FP17_KLEPN|nr:Aspartokinase [Klebsiella pneumoniae]
MATFGAKVLHPATLLPAVRSDIPVFVGSSKEPKAGGTLVCKTTEKPAAVPRAGAASPANAADAAQPEYAGTPAASSPKCSVFWRAITSQLI